MIKKFSKIIAITLVFSMVFMSVSTQHISAASKNVGTTTAVLEDNDNVAIAESADETYRYVATNDKTSNTITVEQYSISTGNLIKTVKVPGNGSDDQTQSTYINRNASLYSSPKNQNTYCNYEYTKTYGTPNVWELRRPDPNASITATIYYKTKQTVANEAYLTAFYNDVEKINTLEGQLIAAAGMEVFLLGVAVALAFATSGMGAPLSAYLASVGATGAACSIAIDIGGYCSDAEDKYYEVKARSTIFY